MELIQTWIVRFDQSNSPNSIEMESEEAYNCMNKVGNGNFSKEILNIDTPLDNLSCCKFNQITTKLKCFGFNTRTQEKVKLNTFFNM